LLILSSQVSHYQSRVSENFISGEKEDA
jgi:hypothetical protein